MTDAARVTCPACRATFPVTDPAETFICPVCAGFTPNVCGAPSDGEPTDLLVTDEDRRVPSIHTVDVHSREEQR